MTSSANQETTQPMDQILELLVWLGGGVIFLFVFLVALDLKMKKTARANQSESGPLDEPSGDASDPDAESERR